MKCPLYLSLINALMTYAVCAKEFKFGSPTCVDVMFDAEFTLTDGENTAKFNQDDLTVKSGLCANENQTVSNIRMENVKGDALVFTFTKSSNSSVTLNTLFYFSPNDFFNTTDDTGFNADDIGTTDIAAPDEKFECNSQQNINFSPQRSFNKNYTLVLVMSNVQMQAFDMQNGQFSDKVFVCHADISTVQPTTAPTEATSTSPAPITTVPANTVPTILAPPRVLTYMFPSDKPCIIMEGSFQLKIKYQRVYFDAKKYINFPSTNSDVTVTGSCPHGTKSSLTLSFGKDNAKRTLTYNFAFDNKNEASIESWEAKVDLDPADFPNAKDTSLDVTFNDTVKLSQNTMYYQCLAPQMLGKDPLTFITRYFKVQAFNVTDNFADDGIDCAADVNPPPNPSAPPTNIYSLTQDQNTCLVFKAGIKFTIPYVSNFGKTTELIALPTNYTIGGSCNMTGSEYYTQQLIIIFYDAWRLSMEFTSDVKNAPANLLAAGAPTSYYLSNVNLDYDINSNLFFDAAPTEMGKTFSVQSIDFFGVFLSPSRSYLCRADTSFDINGVTMTTKNLQYQAFKVGNTTTFAEASECTADDDSDDMVVFIYALAIAGGLFVFAIVVYIIYRMKHRRRDYDILTI